MKPFENAPDDLPALRLKLPFFDFGPPFRVADILLHVSDAVVAIDRYGRITYWNKAAERFYNRKAEEVIGKPLTDAYQFRWLKEGAEAEAAEALSGRGFWQGENIHVKKNGEAIYVESSVSQLRGPGGEAAGALAIIRNITERKLAEQRTAEREKHLRRQNEVLVALAKSQALTGGDLTSVLREITRGAAETLEIERVSIWTYDEGRSRIRCINLYERSAGRHSDGAELASADYPSYFSALELERIIAANDAYTDPRTCEFSEAYLVPLGITAMLDAPLWLNGRIIGVVCHEQVGPPRRWSSDEQNFAGAVANLISNAMESDERKRAEEGLRRLTRQVQEQADALDGILLASVDQIYVLDRKGHYKYVSAEGARLLGLTPSEMIGKRWSDIGLPANIMQRFDSERKGVMSTGQPVRNEISFGLRHYEYIISPARNKDKVIDGTVVVSRDVTDHKYTDIELRKTKEAAEEANRAKDEFLAVVSHELRTPLNAILGWAQLLQTRALNQETAAGALESIERNAKAQAQLINDLLDVSRIITGKLRLDTGPLDLSSVIESALDSVGPTAKAKEIRIVSRIEPLAGEVWGDPDRLKQVIWNLLSNAIKFTPKRGQVEIGLTQIGSNAQVSVVDTGAGIDREFLPYIFGRFYQAESANTRANGGLGLGLAIVRHLVELHGGAVYADSRGEGQGAAFIVTLPVHSIPFGKEGLETRPMSEQEPSIDGPAVLEGLQILVVDDDADSLIVMRTVFEWHGAGVIQAAS
ncbi:MAG TPA: PAS domain-containing protein, partial [Candidatus Manganitrophaceae bacterium]|nr:PAS domain-containing protein [Candidatus Manganitrophaceae bacterium]